MINSVKSKFAFADTIKSVINEIKNSFVNVNSIPTLSININSSYYTGELTILDLSWYSKFKTYGDVIITGFVYLFFIWRLFIHLPSIISGTGGGIESSVNISNFVERSKK